MCVVGGGGCGGGDDEGSTTAAVAAVAAVAISLCRNFTFGGAQFNAYQFLPDDGGRSLLVGWPAASILVLVVVPSAYLSFSLWPGTPLLLIRRCVPLAAARTGRDQYEQALLLELLLPLFP